MLWNNPCLLIGQGSSWSVISLDEDSWNCISWLRSVLKCHKNYSLVWSLSVLLSPLYISLRVELTLIVGPDQLVSGVAGEVPGVPQAEAVPGPLDHTDLVLDTAGESYLKIRRMCLQSVKTSRISKQKLISAQSNSVWTQRSADELLYKSRSN